MTIKLTDNKPSSPHGSTQTPTDKEITMTVLPQRPRRPGPSPARVTAGATRPRSGHAPNAWEVACRPRLARGHRLRARAVAAAIAITAALPMAAAAPVAALPPTPAAGAGGCVTGYPTSQLTAGMSAFGLTVSSGDTPERFSVEILGVLHDGIAPGIDMILIRASSPALTAAGGIWAGMSGSPIYADDGRLIGALSYGLSGGPSLTAGLTPAGAMFDVLNPSSPAARTAALAKRAPVGVPRTLQDALVRTHSATRIQAAGGLQTLPDPISVSGLSSRRLASARTRLARMGLAGQTLYASAAASSAPSSPAPAPVAGGNLAALASTGDATIGGISTTTYVCQSTVLGFGHPAFGLGATTQTAHRAQVLEVQPDPLLGPYKVANIGAQFGLLDSDRLVGIRVRAGATTPVTQVISDTVDQRSRRARHGISAVSVPSFLPLASFIHLMSNSDTVTQRFGEGASSLTWTVTGTGANGARWTLTRRNAFASREDIASDSTFELPTMLQELLSNPFQPVTVDTVRVHASFTPTFNQYTVGRVLRSANGHYLRVNPHRILEVRAGTVLKLRVVLTPYQGRGGPRTVDYSFRIPKRAHGGGIVTVTDGRSGLPDHSSPDAASFRDLLHQLAGAPSNDTLTAALHLGFTKSTIQHVKHLGAVTAGFQAIKLHIQPNR